MTDKKIAAEKDSRTEPMNIVRNDQFVGGIFAHGSTISERFIMIPEGIHLRPLAPAGVDLIQNNPHSMASQTIAMMSNVAQRRQLYNYPEHAPEIQSHYYHPGDLIYDMQLYFFESLPSNFEINGTVNIVYHTKGIVTNGDILRSVRQYVIHPQHPILQDESTYAYLWRVRPYYEKEHDDYAMSCIPPYVKNESLTGHDETIISKEVIWGTKRTLGSVLKLLKERHKEGHYFIYACRGVDDIGKLYANLQCIGIDQPGDPTATQPGDPPERDTKMLPLPPLKRSISLTDEFKNFNMVIDTINTYYDTLHVKSGSIEQCKQLIPRIRIEYELSKEDFCKLYECYIFIRKNQQTYDQLIANITNVIGITPADFVSPDKRMVMWKTYTCALMITKFIIDSRYNISSNLVQLLHIDARIGANIRIMLNKHLFDPMAYVHPDQRVDQMALKCEKFVNDYLKKYDSLNIRMNPKEDSFAKTIYIGLKADAGQIGGTGYNKYHNAIRYMQYKHAYLLLST